MKTRNKAKASEYLAKVKAKRWQEKQSITADKKTLAKRSDEFIEWQPEEDELHRMKAYRNELTAYFCEKNDLDFAGAIGKDHDIIAMKRKKILSELYKLNAWIDKKEKFYIV